MNTNSSHERHDDPKTNSLAALEQEIIGSLNLKNWTPGPDLDAMYKRLSKEVGDAVNNETEAIKYLREEVFPLVEKRFADLPIPCRGMFDQKMISATHENLLFNGGVEAIDATLTSHDSLPISVSQIGICMVSYRGDIGAYSHRLFQKDLRVRGEDSLQETLDWLDSRREMSISPSKKNHGTELARRGLRAFAERKVMVEESSAHWRMGRGNLIPMELFTDYWIGSNELLDASLEMLRNLVAYKRIVFVPSQTRRLAWLTLGNALRPQEYLILGPVKFELSTSIQKRHLRTGSKVRNFVEECGEEIVFGIFRATAYAPPRLFYAHREHANMAALIAISDGMLHIHRGFPMLLDLADSICKATFNPQSFQQLVNQGFAQAGHPFRYPG